jgi:hypothetical protein
MSERMWARDGQIGTALAGIAAVVVVIIALNTPGVWGSTVRGKVQ